MKKSDITISNGEEKNLPSNEIYEHFNNFIFSKDIKILGKLLHRFQHYLNIKDLPGDIVEVGVFKGSGMSTFLKFNQIYCPNSIKKVIGFDIFGVEESQKYLENYDERDKVAMNYVYDRVEHKDLSYDSVYKRLSETEISTSKFEMIEGDVEETLPKFLEENPGFRISMLYIDVDLERPTYFALKYLYDRIIPGGVIIFDELEYHKYTESNGLQKFITERNLKIDIKSTNWMSPTAYFYKTEN